MIIRESFLPINGFSRTGNKRRVTRAIVLHNVGVPNQSAKNVQGYFASLADQDAMDSKPDISASAHFVIDLDGTIYQLMPLAEKAYHCGSGTKDPKSGLIYTDKARAKLKEYASNPLTLSPNAATIGIEMCHGVNGTFTAATVSAVTELCIKLCKDWVLTEEDVMTHNEVVGWKECPLLWTKKPSYFIAFKEDVRRGLCSKV